MLWIAEVASRTLRKAVDAAWSVAFLALLASLAHFPWISRTGGFGFGILAKGFSVGQPFAFRTNPKRHRLLSASQAVRLRHAHLLVVW
jgi:hypothetical protein